MLGAAWVLAAQHAMAELDSRANIEKAVALIDTGDHQLARSYLAPALIDFRLSAQERSRAYYLRGYSFFAQQLYVSAGKDYYRALQFKPDNPAAQAALGNLHFRGLGVAREPELALQLLSQAAHRGHIGARFQVAIAELNGVGTPQDLDSARRWLLSLADQGHSEALVHLGRSYRAELTDQPDPEAAQRWYQRAWTAGDAEGLLGLAFMHKRGEFGEADPTRALELLQQAASAGSGPAQVSLGHMHLTGDLVAQDPAAAVALFRQAAELHTPASYLWLGHVYHAGVGVEANAAAARDWYRQAASAGLGEAQTRLTYLLLQSDDLSDQREALRLLAEASQGENPRAQNDYAWVLATHQHASLRDGQLALGLAQKAVAQNASPSYLDTLAAAHAELGDFDSAVATQQTALELAQDGQKELLEELQAHLAAYRDRRPWRE